MGGQSVERSLEAVLAADVAGFTGATVSDNEEVVRVSKSENKREAE